MRTMSKKTAYITQAALIAALYTVLTMIAAGFDLASGAIQVRFSEALTIMPFFTPAAIPGLTLGCLLSNILTGCVLPDVIFGTLATLLGALGSCALRKNRFLCAIPPIVSADHPLCPDLRLSHPRRHSAVHADCRLGRTDLLHGPWPAPSAGSAAFPRKTLWSGQCGMIRAGFSARKKRCCEDRYAAGFR